MKTGQAHGAVAARALLAHEGGVGNLWRCSRSPPIGNRGATNTGETIWDRGHAGAWSICRHRCDLHNMTLGAHGEKRVTHGRSHRRTDPRPHLMASSALRGAALPYGMGNARRSSIISAMTISLSYGFGSSHRVVRSDWSRARGRGSICLPRRRFIAPWSGRQLAIAARQRGDLPCR